MPAWGVTTFTKVVDPDNGAGTDYTSLDAWEDAFGGNGNSGDLTGDDEIRIAQCRASSGADDTTAVDISGWTSTDATRYIRIELHTDETNTGIWNASNYILAVSNGLTLRVREDFVRIDDIQVQATQSDAGDAYGIYVDGQAASNDVWISNCILKGVCSGTGNDRGIMVNDADTIIKIWNCVVYDFFISADTGFRGIAIDGCAGYEINNCTVYNCTRGMDLGTQTGTVRNCAVGICDDDFKDCSDIDYIVCDDDESANCANYHAFPTNGTGDWSLDYETAGSDFRLKSSATNLIDDGVSDPGDPEQDHTDIAGTARGASWDIGAFEYTAPAVGAPQVIFVN
jgi:hypothetical protein